MSGKTKKINYEIDSNNCYVCTSHKPNDGGYPLMRMNKKIIRIHRYIYEECFGEIPDGMVVRHKCDNPICINPEHLEIGTQAENVQDMITRGRKVSRGAKGEKNCKAKLTQKQVAEIRERYKNGGKPSILMKEYNIKGTAMYDILRRRSWKHI